MERKHKTDVKTLNNNVFYCTNCGSELHEGQDVCLSCGVFVEKGKRIKKNSNKTIVKTKEGKSVSFTLIEMISVILITGILVATASGLIVYKNYGKYKSNSSDNKDNITEIEKAYNQLLDKYYGSIDRDELTNAAIKGMYNYLGDPYSSYLDADDSADLKERLDGEFVGLGIEFTYNENGHEIMNVFEGAPADKYGLLKGDIIIKVNGEDITNLSPNDVAAKIKNTNKSKVSITVKRNNEEITKEVVLSRVVIPSVSSNIYDKTGYVKISTFSQTTADQVSDTLKDLESQGITGLVIDLRNNGGGLLNSAVDIASLFLEKGTKIYGLQMGNSKKFYSDETKEKRDYKISILINGSSASASEILAAALKESYGATLVGTRSYGKGTVQETSDLSTGAMVKYTTGYWLTPKGNNINTKGLTPDIEDDTVYSDDITYENDKALQKAIEAVK